MFKSISRDKSGSIYQQFPKGVPPPAMYRPKYSWVEP